MCSNQRPAFALDDSTLIQRLGQASVRLKARVPLAATPGGPAAAVSCIADIPCCVHALAFECQPGGHLVQPTGQQGRDIVKQENGNGNGMPPFRSSLCFRFVFFFFSFSFSFSFSLSRFSNLAFFAVPHHLSHSRATGLSLLYSLLLLNIPLREP